MTCTRPRVFSFLALGAVLTLGAVGPTAALTAHAASPAPMPGVGACPALATCDTALGVSVMPPAGWSVAPAGQYTPGSLTFVKAVTISTGSDPRMSIQPLGTITTTSNTVAATTSAADALVARSDGSLPVTRTMVTIAGVPAIALQGLPGQQPTLQTVVAHGGALYDIVTFGGNTLQPDQQAALAALRFIPRVGPFPPADAQGPFVPARGNPRRLPVLTARPADGATVVIHVQGAVFRPGEAISVRVYWTGVPRHAAQPYDLYYTLFQNLIISRQGTLDTAFSIPTPPQTYRSYSVSASASDTRTGHGLASSPAYAVGK